MHDRDLTYDLILGEELVDGLLEHVAQVQRGWSADGGSQITSS